MTGGGDSSPLTKALTLHQQGRLAEAATLYRAILLQQPNDANALHLLGVVELHRQNPVAAIALIDRAIKIHPNAAAFYCNRGLALQDLNRFEEALTSYNRALALKPDHAEALNNRGNVLQTLKRYDEALACYDRALAIKPDLPWLRGRHLHCKMLVCDWHGLSEDFARLGKAVDSGEKASSPFSALIAPLSAAQLRKCAEVYAAGKYPEKSIFPAFEPPSQKERIRLGYFLGGLS